MGREGHRDRAYACVYEGEGVCVYIYSHICVHTYKINGTYGGCLIYFPISFSSLKNQNGQ